MRILSELIVLISVLVTASGFAAEKPEGDRAVAVFAGGCFWCMQPPYDTLKAKGVISTRVGYTGGSVKNPTYKQVSAGETGHYEAIEVTYDPKKIAYTDLLKTFWKNIDPFDGRGQFCDHGDQYRSAVFWKTEDEKKAFAETLSELKFKSGDRLNVKTQLVEAKEFYPAEDYHQAYYEKNPIRYKYYRHRCGRDDRLKEIGASF